MPKKPLEDKPGDNNWVEKAGGLPTYIKDIAEHIKGEGKGDSEAIAAAVNTVKRWAAGGTVRPNGGGKVSEETQAKAAKALAEWEKMKASTKLSQPVDQGAYEAALARARSGLGLSVTTFDPQAHPRDWTGRFRDVVDGLSDGDSAELPGGIKVTRHDEDDGYVRNARFEVTKGGDTIAETTIFDDAADEAAQAAIDDPEIDVPDEESNVAPETKSMLDKIREGRKDVAEAKPSKASDDPDPVAVEKQLKDMGVGTKITLQRGSVRRLDDDAYEIDGATVNRATAIKKLSGVKLSQEVHLGRFHLALNQERATRGISVSQPISFDFDPNKHPRDMKGKFREVVGGLKDGGSVGLPDGTRVTKEGGSFNVSKGGKSVGANIKDVGAASEEALGVSARSKDPNSIGGAQSHKSVDKAIEAHDAGGSQDDYKQTKDVEHVFDPKLSINEPAGEPTIQSVDKIFQAAGIERVQIEDVSKHGVGFTFPGGDDEVNDYNITRASAASGVVTSAEPDDWVLEVLPLDAYDKDTDSYDGESLTFVPLGTKDLNEAVKNAIDSEQLSWAKDAQSRVPKGEQRRKEKANEAFKVVPTKNGRGAPEGQWTQHSSGDLEIEMLDNGPTARISQTEQGGPGKWSANVFADGEAMDSEQRDDFDSADDARKWAQSRIEAGDITPTNGESWGEYGTRDAAVAEAQDWLEAEVDAMNEAGEDVASYAANDAGDVAADQLGIGEPIPGGLRLPDGTTVVIDDAGNVVVKKPDEA